MGSEITRSQFLWIIFVKLQLFFHFSSTHAYNTGSFSKAVTTTAAKTTTIIQKEQTLLKNKICPIGYFECKVSYLLCVPQSANCNGKVECPDKSDEENCIDSHSKGEWDWAFVKRPDEDAEKEMGSCKYDDIREANNDEKDKGKISEYTLITNEDNFPLMPLHEIPSSESVNNHPILLPSDFSDELKIRQFEDASSTLKTKPTNLDWEVNGCFCASEKLFCQNLVLSDLKFLPWNVEYLDLSGSRVENMDLTSNLPKVKTLILSSCFIEFIEPGVLSQLSNLRVLYLTNNRLRYIPNDMFSGPINWKLEKLFLDYNQITILQPKSFEGLSYLTELNLRHNLLIGREVNVFKPLKSLKILHLNNNKIESLRKKFFQGLSNLITLTLSNNDIVYIEEGSFEDLFHLEQLYLNWNKIKVLQDKTFCSLGRLLTLNLRGNEIVGIKPSAFECLDVLSSLNLEQNRFREFIHAEEIFINLTSLTHIYFDQFWMCSWAPHVRSCEPKGDGISSVKNLLDNVVLRVCVWIMGLLSVFGNLFVIFCRIIVREPNRIHSFYIRNLAVADLLMGVFLISIAIHDITYRGEFLTYQYAWRHSLTCKLSGLLSTWSSESSVLILTLITLDRYISIVQPFKEKTASLHVAFGICSFLWIISFLLSYVPLSGLFDDYFGENFYTGNGLCLPLHIHNPYDPAWEYSFFLFVLLNSFAFIFICFAYVRMLGVIQKSTLMIRSTQQKQDSLLAKRFSLVVFTDFLCWSPIVVAKVVGMSGVTIPADLYAWLAVFALPVNSALNPIIYTLTTKLFKQQIVKYSRSVRLRIFKTNQMDESSASLSILRYRTPRTGNSSITASGRRNRDKIDKVSMHTSSIRANNIQLQVIVPSLIHGSNQTERLTNPPPVQTNSI